MVFFVGVTTDTRGSITLGLAVRAWMAGRTGLMAGRGVEGGEFVFLVACIARRRRGRTGGAVAAMALIAVIVAQHRCGGRLRRVAGFTTRHTRGLKVFTAVNIVALGTIGVPLGGRLVFRFVAGGALTGVGAGAVCST